MTASINHYQQALEEASISITALAEQILTEADKDESSSYTLGGLVAALRITGYRVEELAKKVPDEALTA